MNDTPYQCEISPESGIRHFGHGNKIQSILSVNYIGSIRDFVGQCVV